MTKAKKTRVIKAYKRNLDIIQSNSLFRNKHYKENAEMQKEILEMKYSFLELS